MLDNDPADPFPKPLSGCCLNKSLCRGNVTRVDALGTGVGVRRVHGSSGLCWQVVLVGSTRELSLGRMLAIY